MILRQVPIDIAPGDTFRVDWVIFYADGEVKFVDAKGQITARMRSKMKRAEKAKGITISVLKGRYNASTKAYDRFSLTEDW